MKQTQIIIMILFLVIFLYIAYGYLNNSYKSEIKNEWNINFKEAYFAWWCFWCMEWVFESQPWVKQAISWYIWWEQQTANYKSVSSWKTKHREAVKVIYNPEIISYKTLVELYWKQIDPTDKWWQFADRWFHYTTAIFYENESEKQISLNSKKSLNESGKFDKEIVTKILEKQDFYKAEDYHQDYYKKNSLKYKNYEKLSWRKDYKDETWNDYEFEQYSWSYIDYNPEAIKNATEEFIVLFFHADWCSSCKAFEKKVLTEEIPENIIILKVNFDKERELKQKYNILTQTSFVIVDNDWNLKKRWIWSRSIEDIIEKTKEIPTSQKTYTKEELKSILTPIQYKVTQEWWTEPPFDNEYWDHWEDWIYVDVIDWTPLFSSTDKFKSWTWWPSFTKPIEENFIKEEDDYKLIMKRTEIKSDKSHLWHVFDDWPKEEWWKRYCINSAALKFIPKEQLKQKWYEKYLDIFQ